LWGFFRVRDFFVLGADWCCTDDGADRLLSYAEEDEWLDMVLKFRFGAGLVICLFCVEWLCDWREGESFNFIWCGKRDCEVQKIWTLPSETTCQLDHTLARTPSPAK